MESELQLFPSEVIQQSNKRAVMEGKTCKTDSQEGSTEGQKSQWPSRWNADAQEIEGVSESWTAKQLCQVWSNRLNMQEQQVKKQKEARHKENKEEHISDVEVVPGLSQSLLVLKTCAFLALKKRSPSSSKLEMKEVWVGECKQLDQPRTDWNKWNAPVWSHRLCRLP